MIGLLVLITLLTTMLSASFYLLGFRLGGEHAQEELLRVRLEAAAAERQLHELTRNAFVAMSEEAKRRGVR